eukprot:GHVU01229497.1.p2 GENE.GHVU01229497.1~~GHVU01229497.1.p2  ORF type:complete len:111 (-),score=22.16 GHVU01229497.1:1334-1666(-)
MWMARYAFSEHAEEEDQEEEEEEDGQNKQEEQEYEGTKQQRVLTQAYGGELNSKRATEEESDVSNSYSRLCCDLLGRLTRACMHLHLPGCYERIRRGRGIISLMVSSCGH